MPDRAGVYVLGMHRSGTSVIARVVDLLGVPVATEGLLAPAAMDNPAGYWEPRDLMTFNEALLRRLGGTWHRPPPLQLTAYAGHVLSDRIPEARERFRVSSADMALDGEKGEERAVASVDRELRRERPGEDAVELSDVQRELVASLLSAAAEPAPAG